MILPYIYISICILLIVEGLRGILYLRTQHVQTSKRFVSLPGKKAKERARKKGTVQLLIEHKLQAFVCELHQHLLSRCLFSCNARHVMIATSCANIQNSHSISHASLCIYKPKRSRETRSVFCMLRLHWYCHMAALHTQHVGRKGHIALVCCMSMIFIYNVFATTNLQTFGILVYGLPLAQTNCKWRQTVRRMSFHPRTLLPACASTCIRLLKTFQLTKQGQTFVLRQCNREDFGCTEVQVLCTQMFVLFEKLFWSAHDIRLYFTSPLFITLS